MREHGKGTILPSGKIRVVKYVPGSNGLSRPLTITQRKNESAEDFYDRVDAEVKAALDRAPSPNMKLEYALDLWLDAKKGKIEDTTMRGYRQDTDRVKKKLGHVRLANVTSITLDSFFEELAEKSGARTAKGVRDTLRNAFRWLKRKKLVKLSEVEDTEPISYTPGISEQITTEAALRAIENAPTPQKRTLFQVMYYTGLRPIEAVRLTWGDLVEAEDGLWIQLGRSKTEMGKQPIPVPKALAETLRGMPRTSVFVFPSPRSGEPYLVGTISKEWLKMQRSVEVLGQPKPKPVRLYALRKLFGRMKARTERREVLRRLMRHQDVRTTEQFYIDAELAELRKANQ